MNYPTFHIISTCKGGGYHYAKTEPLHPKANFKGLYPLHRVLMENHLGRLLESKEEVHHIDGDKENNSLSNLIVLRKSEHAKHHKEERKPLEVGVSCGVCGVLISLKPHRYRLRLKANKTGKFYCSRKCSGMAGKPYP